MNKAAWDDIWFEFEEEAGQQVRCKECGHFLPGEYDDWEKRQKLIKKLVNKALRRK